LGVPLLGEIPIDTKIRIGGDKGEPIMISEPDSLIAKEFMKIAKKLVEATNDKELIAKLQKNNFSF
ncbi:P-loop NTPase, partial [bacterium]|nr:P-loop NTPase [bacterium]